LGNLDQRMTGAKTESKYAITIVMPVNNKRYPPQLRNQPTDWNSGDGRWVLYKYEFKFW